MRIFVSLEPFTLQSQLFILLVRSFLSEGKCVFPQKPQSVYNIKGQLLVQGCSNVLYHRTRSQAYADMLSSPLWRIGQLAAVRAALQGNGCLTRVTADHGKRRQQMIPQGDK